MFTVRIHNQISSQGLSILKNEGLIHDNDNPKPDAIILRSHHLDVKQIPESVSVIARAGVGVNNIPIDECSKRGIVVFNTPGANANSVTELVLCGILLSARKIFEGITWARQQEKTAGLQKLVERSKKTFAGSEIHKKMLGVVGLGAIGVKVSRAAVNMGMQVLGYDPFISIDSAWGLSSRVERCESIDELFSRCDYVSLHIPQTPETEELLNSKRLKKSAKGLKLLNFAREGLVKPKDIKEGLASGYILKYITDFPTPELLGVEGVISTPHLGASTVEAEENCAIMAARQAANFLHLGIISNAVNFPSCSLQKSKEGGRLLISNANIPNMLSQILNLLAKEKINVQDMTNRHLEKIAYNIIELSTPNVSEAVMTALRSIKGIIRVRQIPLQNPSQKN